MSRMALGALTILAMAGCATYTLVEPTRTTIAGVYSVEPQIRWSALARGKVENWTTDGFALHAVRFFKGVEDGEALFGTTGQAKLPLFRATMTPNDIAELVVDTLSKLQAQRLEVRGLRPARFADAEGFRFGLTFLTREGLEKEAIVTGAVIDGKLHMIMYDGAAQHYFPKHREAVERLFESTRRR